MKHKNWQPKRVKYGKLYSAYLKEAVEAGQLSEMDAKFWDNVNKRTVKNPGYTPFPYIYRQEFRSGIRNF